MHSYKSALFHLHSIFEGSAASISGYCHEAREYGVDVVWISDHDMRYRREGFFRVPLGGEYGLQPVNSPPVLALHRSKGRKPSLKFRVHSDGKEWRGGGLVLPYLPKPQRPPLISRPTVELALDAEIRPTAWNNRLIVRFHLSQVPPEHQPAYFDYCLGKPPEGSECLPLPLEGGVARIHLLDDVLRAGWDADHALMGVELRLETRSRLAARVIVRDFTIQTELSTPDELLLAQAELGRELGKKYGVEVFVNYEASGEEGHMTCFGEPLPIPFKDEGKHPLAEITRIMESRNGVTSVNHPFSTLKRESLTEEDKGRAVEEKAEQLLANGAYGAKLMEVGFPEGRHGFQPEHYFRLLDMLNMGGLRMAGIGVSDAHGNRTWEAGNNYANFIAANDCDRESLLAGMRKGDMYMADVARVKGPMRFFTDGGKTMGDTQQGGTAHLEAEGIPRGSELRWIADGESVAEEHTGTAHQSSLPLDRAKRFVRAELRDAYGRLLLATNPIWTA